MYLPPCVIESPKNATRSPGANGTVCANPPIATDIAAPSTRIAKVNLFIFFRTISLSSLICSISTSHCIKRENMRRRLASILARCVIEPRILLFSVRKTPDGRKKRVLPVQRLANITRTRRDCKRAGQRRTELVIGQFAAPRHEERSAASRHEVQPLPIQ